VGASVSRVLSANLCKKRDFPAYLHCLKLRIICASSMTDNGADRFSPAHQAERRRRRSGPGGAASIPAIGQGFAGIEGRGGTGFHGEARVDVLS